jgi:hypothetical protein
VSYRNIKTICYAKGKNRMVDYTKFPKGSEWRKWDLHIHTPASALNNQFNGTDIDDKWQNYFDKLKLL